MIERPNLTVKHLACARSTSIFIFDFSINHRIVIVQFHRYIMATKLVATRLPPRLGTKQIFLYVCPESPTFCPHPIALPVSIPSTATNPPRRPNFTVTLLRPAPGTPPTFASFIVPLNLNKLDMRDYLWNMYSVRVKGVRSYIQQQKVRQDRPGAKRPAPRRWYRPRAVKKMMVELEEPFAWKEEPESFEA